MENVKRVDVSAFEEKKDSIYGLVKDIRIKSDRVVKTLANLWHTYVHKHDSGVDLNLAEEQVTFQLKEINKIYEEIGQSHKKLNELIKDDEENKTPVETKKDPVLPFFDFGEYP